MEQKCWCPYEWEGTIPLPDWTGTIFKIYFFFIGGASSLVAQLVKNPFAMQETLGQEDQLEKG